MPRLTTGFRDAGARRPTDSRALQTLSARLRQRASDRRLADQRSNALTGNFSGTDASNSARTTIAASRSMQKQATGLALAGVAAQGIPGLIRVFRQAAARPPRPVKPAGRALTAGGQLAFSSGAMASRVLSDLIPRSKPKPAPSVAPRRKRPSLKRQTLR